MIPDYVSQLGNHLWQSTLFAALVWPLTLLLKKNRAQLRYWLWLSASMKFLIPFSLLVSIGNHVDLTAWRSTASTPTQPPLPVAIKDVFAPSTLRVAIPAAARSEVVSPIPALLLAVWTAGFLVVLFSWWRQWRRIRKALREATPLHLETRIQAMSSSVLLEPVC